MKEQTAGVVKPFDRYLNYTDVWALAFGCMVGWGVFAMPGTTFLPVAGPGGTLIAMLLGMAVALINGGAEERGKEFQILLYCQVLIQ